MASLLPTTFTLLLKLLLGFKRYILQRYVSSLSGDTEVTIRIRCKEDILTGFKL
jgi:hypothetical protein